MDKKLLSGSLQFWINKLEVSSTKRCQRVYSSGSSRLSTVSE